MFHSHYIQPSLSKLRATFRPISQSIGPSSSLTPLISIARWGTSKNTLGTEKNLRVLWMISFFLLFLLQMVYFSSNFVTIETKGKVHRIRLSLKRQIFNQLEQINYLLLMSMNSYFNNPLGNKSRSSSFFIFSERCPVRLSHSLRPLSDMPFRG